MPLQRCSLKIGDDAWICADAFVGPGVTIGAGAVVGARSVVMRDVEPWIVIGGNPAKKIRDRIIRSSGEPSVQR
jgi:putative colanic acid biosynthesis acetyltransferase WcaF